MALSYRAMYKNCNFIYSITKPVKWNVNKYVPIRIISSSICYDNNFTFKPLIGAKNPYVLAPSIRQCTSQQISGQPPGGSNEEKPGLIKKFKQMYRDYWYVLLPVHMVTSAMWYGGFYYTVSSGVDIINILETIGVSDKLLSPLRESSAGYFALAFALYKLVTPLRYAVTVGGTTFAIRKLTGLGWIKPVPSRERIKEMLQEKRDNLQDRFQESKQHYQAQIKEKRTHMVDEMRRYKTEMRNMKSKVKKM